jgi:hypothetical protein
MWCSVGLIISRVESAQISRTTVRRLVSPRPWTRQHLAVARADRFDHAALRSSVTRFVTMRRRAYLLVTNSRHNPPSEPSRRHTACDGLEYRRPAETSGVTDVTGLLNPVTAVTRASSQERFESSVGHPSQRVGHAERTALCSHEIGSRARNSLKRSHVLGQPVEPERGQAELRTTSFAPGLQIPGRAQTLDVLREAPPTKAQRAPNGDVLAPAHVCQ